MVEPRFAAADLDGVNGQLLEVEGKPGQRLANRGDVVGDGAPQLRLLRHHRQLQHDMPDVGEAVGGPLLLRSGHAELAPTGTWNGLASAPLLALSHGRASY